MLISIAYFTPKIILHIMAKSIVLENFPLLNAQPFKQKLYFIEVEMFLDGTKRNILTSSENEMFSQNVCFSENKKRKNFIHFLALYSTSFLAARGKRNTSLIPSSSLIYEIIKEYLKNLFFF